MTVDFEGNFKDEASLTDNLNKILDLFDKFNASATFFVVGELIEKFPNIVKTIPRKHEIAAHGFRHIRLSKLNGSELKKEIKRSKESILKVTKKCLGFRAPYNIIHPGLGEMLKEEGFIYDSSICRSYFPGRYNNRPAPNKPYLASNKLKKEGNFILEFPISSYSIFKLPFSLSFIRAFNPFYPLKRVMPNSTFYLHNYEIEDHPAPDNISFVTKLFFNRNKEKAIDILKKVLNMDFRYISCIDHIKENHPSLLQ